MRKKDYTRLTHKLLFVKIMQNFWPWCGTCSTSIMYRTCKHKRAAVGYFIELDRKNNIPVIRWKSNIPGICKYWKERKEK